MCSGTFAEAAYEDALAAGALCDLIWPVYSQGAVADSALMTRRLYHAAGDDLLAALAQSRNGKRLLSQEELEADVAFCAERDRFPLVVEMDRTGRVRSTAGVWGRA